MVDDFSRERKGTGTAEWAEVTENITRGCRNDCVYCYAAHNASRFKLRDRSDWSREELTKRAGMTSYPAKGGVVMFPSSHDITPFNVEAYIRVAKLILAKGNRLLIVTKPNLACMERLLIELAPFKKQILFRFTIGSLITSVSRFWEPGAPEPAERLKALYNAHCQGWNTSVSIEPMLEGAEGASLVVEMVEPWVSEKIWIGKMNKARLRVEMKASTNRVAIETIEDQQCDREILCLHARFKDHPKIEWKDSIKQILALREVLL